MYKNDFLKISRKTSVAVILAIIFLLLPLSTGFAYYDPNLPPEEQGPPWDPNPPETSITWSPKSTIVQDFVTLYFSGTDDVTQKAALQYRHKLDNNSWSAYSTATNVKLESLAQGDHTFYVQAKDEAGNEDATPASATFTYMEPLAYLKAVTDKSSVEYQKNQKRMKEAEERKKKLKKQLDEIKKKLNKAKKENNDKKKEQEQKKYKTKKSKYLDALENYYKEKKGTPTANISFMWPNGLENNQLSFYVNIQKRIKSLTRAKKQAHYKKLYKSYWARYKRTGLSEKKLRSSYWKKALKYKKAYKKIKPVYYKTVKKYYLVQPTPNAWQTIQYSGGYGSYKYVGYGLSAGNTKPQQFTQGKFKFKFSFKKKL